MPKALVTGSYGLVGSYISTHLFSQGWDVTGIDCDARSSLFPDVQPLDEQQINKIYEGCPIPTFNIDLRDSSSLDLFFQQSINSPYDLVVHCAAQPSHDWAAHDPITDKCLNIDATLSICECLRHHSPHSLLIYLSTNKVYGDTPNQLPLLEQDFRFELASKHPFFNGINESMSIDNSLHSLFGVSKTSADLYVQEYSRYFGIPAVILRGGCLTGPRHRGAKLHGFMNYLIRCALDRQPYTVIGYQGKQVRDNLHAQDIALLIETIFSGHLLLPPQYPVVANLGGGRPNSCSILELIQLLRVDFHLPVTYSFTNKPRSGDHKWYVTDNSRLFQLYNWSPSLSLHDIITDTLAYLA